MMGAKRNLVLLGFVMIIMAVGVGSITIWVLYNSHIEDTRTRLTEIAQSQARIMESVANFDKQYSSDYPGGAEAATISKIQKAHKQFAGFGKTGEFTLARKVEDKIVFILRHRHSDLDKPNPVPISGNRAEPMRKALSGESGSVIGLDYRGVEVLAAYEPVAILNLGIVAKIDMEEIRTQFDNALKLLIALSICIIFVFGFIFYLVSRPLIKRDAEHKRLGRILDTSINEVFIINADTFNFSWVNKGAKSNLGYTDNELSGLRPWDLNPDIKESDFNNMVQPLLDGENLQLSFETRLRRKDGTTYLVEVRLQLFHQDESPLFVAIIQDISKKKKAELALAEAESNHLITLNSIGDAVISTDIEGRVQFMNPVAETLTGWSSDEAKQRPLSDVFRIINYFTREVVPNPVEKVGLDHRFGHYLPYAASNNRCGTDGCRRLLVGLAGTSS